MRSLALSAIGRDRPGIVAGVSAVLLEHGVNIEDSQMTILRGHFAMTLVLALDEGADVESLRADLESCGGGLGLDAIALQPIDEEGGGDAPDASHIVSVYGVDHPGIVHAVAKALAERGWSITDLDTRVLGDASNPLYVMVIEVALPAGTDAGALEQAMGAVAEEQGVEITARPLEHDAL
jgi:glycine cleavage system transcriptional repressor